MISRGGGLSTSTWRYATHCKIGHGTDYDAFRNTVDAASHTAVCTPCFLKATATLHGQQSPSLLPAGGQSQSVASQGSVPQRPAHPSDPPHIMRDITAGLSDQVLQRGVMAPSFAVGCPYRISSSSRGDFLRENRSALFSSYRGATRPPFMMNAGFGKGGDSAASREASKKGKGKVRSPVVQRYLAYRENPTRIGNKACQDLQVERWLRRAWIVGA